MKKLPISGMLLFGFSTGCAHYCGGKLEIDEYAACVRGWSVGPSTRERRTIPNARLHLAKFQGAELTPVDHECVEATSILPAPAPEVDRRIFMAAGGRLVVLGQGNVLRELPVKSAPEPESGDLVLEELFAYEALSSPLRMLVSVRRQADMVPELWVATIENDGVSYAVPDFSGTSRGKQSFFESHIVPRCAPDGTACLSAHYSYGVSTIDYYPGERWSGEPTLATTSIFDGIEVIDVVYPDSSGETILALVVEECVS